MEKKDAIAIRENQVTVYDNFNDPLAAIKAMGKSFAGSGLFGVNREDQGFVLAMACFVERKNPIEICNEYHIIEGKLSMKARAIHAKFLDRGGRIVWNESSNKVCEATFYHEKYCPKGHFLSLTMEELINSGVAVGKGGSVKSNYKKFPRQMLRARLISEGVTMIDPGTTQGLYTPEEVSDFDTRDIVIPRAEETKPETTTNDDRSKKVISMFKSKFGVIQSDLEKHICCSIADWEDKDYKALLKIYKKLISAEDIPAAVQETFKLEPGATG